MSLSLLLWGVLRAQTPPDLFNQSDKWMHFLAFFGFSLATCFAFCKHVSWRVWVWALLLFSAPGLEYLQHYLQATRHFSLGDVAGNVSGVVGAWPLWRVYLFKVSDKF
jgi:hypothetical protein